MQTPFNAESSVMQRKTSLGKSILIPSAVWLGGRRSKSGPTSLQSVGSLARRLLNMQHSNECAESLNPCPPLASGCLSHALSAVPAVCASSQLPLLTSEPLLRFVAGSVACSVLRQACRDAQQGWLLLVQTKASISDPSYLQLGVLPQVEVLPKKQLSIQCQSHFTTQEQPGTLQQKEAVKSAPQQQTSLLDGRLPTPLQVRAQAASLILQHVELCLHSPQPSCQAQPRDAAWACPTCPEHLRLISSSSPGLTMLQGPAWSCQAPPVARPAPPPPAHAGSAVFGPACPSQCQCRSSL